MIEYRNLKFLPRAQAVTEAVRQVHALRNDVIYVTDETKAAMSRISAKVLLEDIDGSFTPNTFTSETGGSVRVYMPGVVPALALGQNPDVVIVEMSEFIHRLVMNAERS